VANYQVTVKELPDQIIFLHQVQPGGADRSYGIEAGRLAGLPASVIQRAKQVMTQIEKHSHIAIGLRQGNKQNYKNTQEKKVKEKNETYQIDTDSDDSEQLDMFS
jgi:DNA mismatch repair protein MutS